MKILDFFKKNKFLGLILGTYVGLFIIAPDKGIAALRNSAYYFKEMLEILPAVFILIALIDTWISRKAIMNKLGENSGIKGGVLSFILGSLSAGPLYGAFPICKMLLRKGASVTNVVVMLCAWAVVKVPMLINEVKFIGFKFMIIRWILTVISIVIIAFIMKKFVKREMIHIYEKSLGECDNEENLIIIREEYCMGCGICEKIMPDNFYIEGNKVEIKKKLKESDLPKLDEIVDKCPGNALEINKSMCKKEELLTK